MRALRTCLKLYDLLIWYYWLKFTANVFKAWIILIDFISPWRASNDLFKVKSSSVSEGRGVITSILLQCVATECSQTSREGRHPVCIPHHPVSVKKKDHKLSLCTLFLQNILYLYFYLTVLMKWRNSWVSLWRCTVDLTLQRTAYTSGTSWPS